MAAATSPRAVNPDVAWLSRCTASTVAVPEKVKVKVPTASATSAPVRSGGAVARQGEARQGAWAGSRRGDGG